jgi:sulfonate transport system substrate-binding protein
MQTKDNPEPSRRGQWLALVLTILALFALAALVPAHAQAQAQARPEQLLIGFQKLASLLTLQKSQGTLEKRLAPLGVSVKWVEFPAGPQLLEGLNVGAVDVGFVGEAPPIFAQAAPGLPPVPPATAATARRKAPSRPLPGATPSSCTARCSSSKTASARRPR